MDIALIDDHPLFRDGIKRFVTQAFTEATLKEVGDAAQLQQLVDDQQTDYDLIISDLCLPDYDWREGLSKLRQAYPLAVIVVVSMLDEDDVVQTVMQYGANAFIAKSTPAYALIGLIKQALSGDSVIHTSRSAQPEQTTPCPPDLSDRQMQILRLLAQGKTNKEIAKTVHLSPFTVRHHVSVIMKILNASSRVEAVSVAVRDQLI